MSNKIKTASSLSADSTEIRYQKALKQITKLISLNTQLRDELNRSQQCVMTLHQQLQKQQQQLQKITQHKTKLETQINQFITTINSIHSENEELKKEISRLKTSKNTQEFGLRKKQTRDSYFEGQKSSQHLRVFTYLERVLQQRDETIKELKAKLKFMEASSGEFGNGKILNAETIKQDLNSREINKKLQSANQYINKLNNQCADLKTKLIKVESKNMLLGAKSMENLHKYTKYSPQITPRNHPVLNGELTTNSAQVLKRYHKLEQQNKKLIKKCDQYHYDIDHLKTQKLKLQKQHDRSGLQVAKYEQLVKKQQDIISKLHSDFDEEIQKMTNQFKSKLLQQRESFSPGKAAQNLKVIQNLQSQNKQLKKKFHLCSIQLTKCFKTLQIYKTKLNQCQQDYGELLTQKQLLLQKLKHLQVTQRDYKQKSSHSRGSVTKLGDGDRRNSMGQTGKFTYV